MAIFRVERNKGYTVMSNHHLRNKELSLKAKGLLSQMLSLPEDWDYKSLSFSAMEGKHGVYALISKDENRDRSIKKPRPSLRAQLEADKAKTTPKKAAAKSKNHEMEV